MFNVIGFIRDNQGELNIAIRRIKNPIFGYRVYLVDMLSRVYTEIKTLDERDNLIKAINKMKSLLNKERTKRDFIFHRFPDYLNRD